MEGAAQRGLLAEVAGLIGQGAQRLQAVVHDLAGLFQEDAQDFVVGIIFRDGQTGQRGNGFRQGFGLSRGGSGSRAGHRFGRFSHVSCLGRFGGYLERLGELRQFGIVGQRLLPGSSRLRQGLGHKVHGGWRRRRHRRCCRSGFGRQVLRSLGGLDLGHGQRLGHGNGFALRRHGGGVQGRQLLGRLARVVGAVATAAHQDAQAAFGLVIDKELARHAALVAQHVDQETHGAQAVAQLVEDLGTF